MRVEAGHRSAGLTVWRASLQIGGISSLDDDCIAQLARSLPALEKFALAGARKLTPTALRVIAEGWPALRHLALEVSIFRASDKFAESEVLRCGLTSRRDLDEEEAPLSVSAGRRVCCNKCSCEVPCSLNASSAAKPFLNPLRELLSWCLPFTWRPFLQNCGRVTAAGADVLLASCWVLASLKLVHSGRGLPEDFIPTVAARMPLLTALVLDGCDAAQGRFALLEVRSLELVLLVGASDWDSLSLF